MNTTDLSKLEIKVNNLLESLEKLQSENHSLRKKLAKLAQAKADIQEKNKAAATRIRQIITHLREDFS